MIAHPLTLCGRFVRLEPLEPEHIAPLMAIAQATPEAFVYTSTPVTEAQRDTYFDKAFSDRERGEAYPFVIKAAERVIGTSRYADIRWQHRHCELGYTWLDSRYQGGGANVESKYLMLKYLFEEQGFLRVQLHTDARNLRSQEAIRRLGAVYEGVLRRHMVAKDGFVRDTMVFAITDLDWPSVKAQLAARLEVKLAALHLNASAG
ncbi:MAG: GNAT family N-acetyltransferase [Truepera sp.]|nr:GNAT family N-acetyltransferase [Truepera sp.]